jgi:hypothetical protein
MSRAQAQQSPVKVVVTRNRWSIFIKISLTGLLLKQALLAMTTLNNVDIILSFRKSVGYYDKIYTHYLKKNRSPKKGSCYYDEKT